MDKEALSILIIAIILSAFAVLLIQCIKMSPMGPSIIGCGFSPTREAGDDLIDFKAAV
jgi:hypothetical protein